MFPPDKYKKFRRGPQVITLKDAALISSYTGVGEGDRVLDAGGGSGFLTVYLANLVGKGGKVYSYEIREDFAELVRSNVEKAGFADRVEVKVADVFENIGETELDLVALDMANSEKALANAFAALKDGGYCTGYYPNVEQVKVFVVEGERVGFSHEFTLESIQRELLVRPQGCRPATKGLTHTGYVTFLRKRGNPAVGAQDSQKKH